MAVSYAAWPTTTEVLSKVAEYNVTVGAAVTTDLVQNEIDAVTREIQQETKRQFVAGSAGEVRYFDGSGTGVQPIDEIITFTSVEFLGWTQTSGLLLTNPIVDVQNLYPQDRLYIYRGSVPNIGRVYIDRFPRGRQNIKVTGTWGYASTIPADLWVAAQDEAAVRIIAKVIYKQKGFLEGWKDDDVSITRKILVPGEWGDVHKRFLKTMERYRKPMQRHLATWRPRMV